MSMIDAKLKKIQFLVREFLSQPSEVNEEELKPLQDGFFSSCAQNLFALLYTSLWVFLIFSQR